DHELRLPGKRRRRGKQIDARQVGVVGRNGERIASPRRNRLMTGGAERDRHGEERPERVTVGAEVTRERDSGRFRDRRKGFFPLAFGDAQRSSSARWICEMISSSRAVRS